MQSLVRLLFILLLCESKVHSSPLPIQPNYRAIILLVGSTGISGAIASVSASGAQSSPMELGLSVDRDDSSAEEGMSGAIHQRSNNRCVPNVRL